MNSLFVYSKKDADCNQSASFLQQSASLRSSIPNNCLLLFTTSAGDLLNSVKSLYFCFTRIILLKKTAILLKKSGRVFLFLILLKKSGKFFTMHQIYPILILKFTLITIIYSKKVARIFLFFVFTQKKWQSFFILNFTQKKWQSFF